jgi:hypothetical protein
MNGVCDKSLYGFSGELSLALLGKSLLCWDPLRKFREYGRFLVGRRWLMLSAKLVSYIFSKTYLDFLNVSRPLSIDLWFRTLNCCDLGFYLPGVNSKNVVSNFWL